MPYHLSAARQDVHDGQRVRVQHQEVSVHIDLHTPLAVQVQDPSCITREQGQEVLQGQHLSTDTGHKLLVQFAGTPPQGVLPVTHNFRFRASWGMLRTPFLSDISKSNR